MHLSLNTKIYSGVQLVSLIKSKMFLHCDGMVIDGKSMMHVHGFSTLEVEGLTLCTQRACAEYNYERSKRKNGDFVLC